MKKEIIAIIPAKGQSLRVPNKNTSIIDKIPLFMHSVKFALKCGIFPIVSTDSKDIIDICKRNNIKYNVEDVNDSNMFNCIEQVLKHYPAKKFIILQPTSPIRDRKVLNKCIALSNKHKSVITCQDLKFIGFLDGKFHIAFRDQDTSRRFYHFDGNILVANSYWVLKNKCLFSKDITFVKNYFPYYLQIDDKNEQTVIKVIKEKLDF